MRSNNRKIFVLFLVVCIAMQTIPFYKTLAFTSMNITYLPFVSKPSLPLIAPTGLVASAFSSTQINLSWTDNNNDETAYRVERSPDGLTAWSEIANLAANTTSYPNSGLNCATHYFYRVRAYRSRDSSFSSYSNLADATTNSCLPPAAPTGLSATTISASQINLSWTDNSNNETAFRVERSPNGSSSWVEIADLPANTTSYPNSGLNCATQYFYRTRAYRSTDDSYSSYSNIANATTSTCPPPPITGNVQITYIFYDGSGTSEPDEYVEIKNNDVFSIQLSNWTLRDNQSHIFTFPSFVIQPGQICRVYTNEDHPEWCGFNYHSGSAIWNNTGDCGYLRDSATTLISQYCYP